MYFGNVSGDGTNPETNDKSWNFNMSNVNIGNWIHDGPLTSNFFNIYNQSSITLGTGSIINTQNTIFNSQQLSTINVNNLTATECSSLINANESKCIRLNTITNEGSINNTSTFFINVEGGTIFLTGVTGYSINGNVLLATDVQAHLQSNNFNSTNGYGAYFINSYIQALDTNITATGGSALIMQTDTFRIDGFTGYSTFNVLDIQQNSKGYLANIHGNSTNSYGVNLQSASSFSNAGNNDVSGSGGPGINDVNTGNAGSSSWLSLITDDFPPTVTPSQYVTISPA